MIRKIFSFLITLIVLSCMVFTVSAQDYFRVVDNANILLPEEVDYLEDYATQLYDYYGIDAVILTVDSLMGETPQDYADNFYDNTGYSEDGALFLLAMEEREWYISTSGNMRYVLTDYGIQQVGEATLLYFADGLWFDGFCAYLITLPEYLDAYEQGTPIDGYADYSGDYYHGDQEEVLYYEEEFTPWFGLSLFCGIVVASIVVLIMRFSMNTKRAQHCASDYMNRGSWKLTQHRDMFLYSKVTKTRKPEANTSASGGGSSVHRSSSGRSHGGGGGKF